MTCVICKKGKTAKGKTSITLERNGLTLFVKDVPAQVCMNCGEGYVDEKTTARILQTAEESSQVGVQVDVRQYVA